MADKSSAEENLRMRLRFGMLNTFEDVDPWGRPIAFSFEPDADRNQRVTSIERLLHASISLRRSKEQVRRAVLSQAQERCDKLEGGAAGYRRQSAEALEGAILQQLADLGQDKQLRNAVFKLHDSGTAWGPRPSAATAATNQKNQKQQQPSAVADSGGRGARGKGIEMATAAAAAKGSDSVPSLASMSASLDGLAAAAGGAQYGAESGDDSDGDNDGSDGSDGSDDDDDEDDDDDDDNDESGGRKSSRAGRGRADDRADPLPAVETVRRQWEKSINEELLAIGHERRQPLLRPRAGSRNAEYGSPHEHRTHRTPSPDHDADVGPMPSLVSAGAPPPLRFLYDSEDLLETIIQIEDESLRDDTEDDIDGPDILGGSLWGLIKINLQTLDMRSLQQRFTEMSLHLWQLGVDDHPLLATNALRSPLPAWDNGSASDGPVDSSSSSNARDSGSHGKGSSHSNSNSRAKQSGSGGGGGNDNGDGVVRPDTDEGARRRVNPEHPAAAGLDNPKEVQDVIGDFTLREMRRGRRVVVESYIPAARHFACSGLPASLRPNVWRVILGLSPGPYGSGPGGAATPGEAWQQQDSERSYYAGLQQHVERVELLTDGK
jgi:hypothetical protein